jgi:hypothetical protein
LGDLLEQRKIQQENKLKHPPPLPTYRTIWQDTVKYNKDYAHCKVMKTLHAYFKLSWVNNDVKML